MTDRYRLELHCVECTTVFLSALIKVFCRYKTNQSEDDVGTMPIRNTLEEVDVSVFESSVERRLHECKHPDI